MTPQEEADEGLRLDQQRRRTQPGPLADSLIDWREQYQRENAESMGNLINALWETQK